MEPYRGFELFDTDRDGFIDAEEYLAAYAPYPMDYQRLFEWALAVSFKKIQSQIKSI